MTLKIDLHVHSVASGHAYNTIYELVQEAKRKKMKAIAITDHTPGDGSLTHNWYFIGLKNIPEKMEGIRVLRGVELEVINKQGAVNLSDDLLEKLDILLIGLHNHAGTLNFKDSDEVTNALITGLKKYTKAKIITHPFSNLGNLDIKKITQYACDNNLLMEVNLAHLNPQINRHHANMEKLKEMIKIVKQNKKKVIVNSDAHFMTWLGNDSMLTPQFMKEIGLTKEMIINNYPEELEKILGVKF